MNAISRIRDRYTDRPDDQLVSAHPCVRRGALIDRHAIVYYSFQMPSIKQTSIFQKWLSGLCDRKARARILVRMGRMEDGNPGDLKPLGGELFEARISYGPGYRLYYVWIDADGILMLCGGTKARQSKDIAKAREIAAYLEDES